MERTSMIHRLRAAALVLAAAPVFAACGSMVDDETIGTAATSTAYDNANVSFIRYAAIGTSLGAGVESGGILDSTQRETYTYQLAQVMGLTPGANWFYPSLKFPGCAAPYTNILTGARLGGASAAACALRTPGSERPFMSNTSIPGLRAIHALDVTDSTYITDATPNRAAGFYTGNVNPVTMVMQQGATFVTLEVGANDVLQAALGGDSTLLTPTAAFTTTIGLIADSLDAIGAAVAIANVPTVTVIPHLTKASTLWGYKNVTCPTLPAAVQATIPYCSPLFAPSATCAPAAVPGGVGDTYLLPFPTTAAVTSTLAAARAASITCGTRDSVLVGTAASPLVPVAPVGPVSNTAETAALTARTTALNSAVQSLATARSYAFVDINAALLANVALIPPLPCFAAGLVPGCTPAQPFGTLFSQDGIHPYKAGYRIMAQTFVTAINTTFGTTLPNP